jgi:hypothetical protein
MSYKPLDDRQVINRAALPNIGSAADDTLDDIFAKINALLAFASNSSYYISQNISLTAGLTSYSVTIPTQPDTSYIVLPMMQNTLDANPQHQQIEVTSKQTTGFTFTWNAPLDTNNYILNFIVPPTTLIKAEVPISSASSSVTATLNIPQNGSNYGIVSTLQNLVDAFPQFQTPVTTSQSATNFVDSWNAPISSSNYSLVYMGNPTGQVSIGSGANSVTVNLPVAYGSTGYSVFASITDLTDTYPKYQPLVITAKSSSQFSIGFNVPTPSSNYLLTYYAISLTT